MIARMTKGNSRHVQLRDGSWSVELGKDGSFRKLSGSGSVCFTCEHALPHPSVMVLGHVANCVSTLHKSGNNSAEWIAQFSVPTLAKPIVLRHTIVGKATSPRELTLQLSFKVLESPAGWEQVEIMLPVPFSLSDSGARLFLPLQSGRLSRPRATNGLNHVLTISGPFDPDPRRRLAIPLLGADCEDMSAQLTVAWDQYATGRLCLGQEARRAGGDHLATPYTEQFGALVGEERTLWCVLNVGEARDHLDVLSRTALADVPPRPSLAA
jgi:hypothetical protein